MTADLRAPYGHNHARGSRTTVVIHIMICARRGVTYITSCLFYYFCDSDIVSLFMNGVKLVVGLSPHRFNISVVVAGDCRTENQIHLWRLDAAPLCRGIEVYPPFGVSSSVPLQRGGSVRSLFCFLSLISCGRKLDGASTKNFLYKRGSTRKEFN